MKHLLKIAGMALALTGGAATAVVTMAGPAMAACTLWPGRNNDAWQNCMAIERQNIEMQRMRSDQWNQAVQMQQQMGELARRSSRPIILNRGGGGGGGGGGGASDPMTGQHLIEHYDPYLIGGLL